MKGEDKNKKERKIPKKKRRPNKNVGKRYTDQRLKGCTPEEKDRVLFNFYCGLSADLSHLQKCEVIANDFGLPSPDAVRVGASRKKWTERYATYCEEKKLKDVQDADDVMEVRNPKTGELVEIPISQLAKDVKSTVTLSLKAAKVILETSTSMIMYYGLLISTRIGVKGGVAGLNNFDMIEIETWNDKIRAHQKSISEFLKPGSVATLLRMIGLDYLGDGEEVDGQALTMATLQERLAQLGMVSAFDKIERTDAIFQQYQDTGAIDMPDITGRD